MQPTALPIAVQSPAAAVYNAAAEVMARPGYIPVSTVAPAIANQKVDFQLRSQGQGNSGIELDAESSANSEIRNADPSPLPVLGFAPFFAQLLAQEGDISVEASPPSTIIVRPEVADSHPVALMDTRYALLTFNAPPYEQARALVEQPELPAIPEDAQGLPESYVPGSSYFA